MVFLGRLLNQLLVLKRVPWEPNAVLNVTADARDADLRLAFAHKCVATHPLAQPWFRRRRRKFDEVVVAYDTLRQDPLKWDPDAFWYGRRCALARNEAACGCGVQHPLAIGVLRSLFLEGFLKRGRLGTVPDWLARRLDAAAEDLESKVGSKNHPEVLRFCAAATESLGSRRRWPPSWVPGFVSRFLKALEGVWFLEVLFYVLRAEFFNSTAQVVYAVAFCVTLARRLGGENLWVRRGLLALDAALASLAAQEVRVAVIAFFALASWIVLGDALELVRIAQQVAFASWGLFWLRDCCTFFDALRQRLQRRLLRREAVVNEWRVDAADIGRLAADVAAPFVFAFAALGLSVVCIVPVAWAVGSRLDDLPPITANAKWDALIAFLVNDDAPSRRSVFVMNAVLVATTLAPFLNHDARASAATAFANLATQLKRRLIDKPVNRRTPDADEPCAICLLPLQETSDGDKPQPMVYCRYGCGKAVHADCMRTWLSQKNQCVFCGTPWTFDL